jgi:hypothetical protein
VVVIREATMVARILLTILFIAAGCTAAAAKDLSGLYNVGGTFANGKTYSNRAAIKMTSENTCDFNYSDNTKGVCMLDGTTLSCGFALEYGSPQVAVYQVAPDGSLEGVFFDNIHGTGFSHEKLTPRN